MVGAGQIGARYDRPGPTPPLTYAHAILADPAFELVGFVDPNQEQGSLAVTRWGGKWFPNLASAWEHSNIDVVCVAVPDERHWQVLSDLAALPFKILLAEKPFTTNPGQAREVLQLFQRRATPVLINYSRRHVPAFNRLAQAVRAGEFGDLLQGAAFYGKGSLHNGSHLVNLLIFLFGEVSFRQRFGTIDDYRPSDPTASVLLSAGPSQSPITLHAIDSRSVSIFELDLFFEKQRIRMTSSGNLLEYYDLNENPDFPGYRNYALVRSEETGLLKALSRFLKLAESVLGGSPAPVADPLDAVTTLEICRQFLA